MNHQAAVLPSQIKELDTMQVLLLIYREHASHLNNVHLSAAWTSLGRLAREVTGKSWPQKHAGALEPLVQHTMQAATG